MKKRIDISNYEEWLIDHLDGILSPTEEEQLNAFLLAHPELSEELEGMEQLSLNPESITMPDKDSLLMPSERELHLLLLAEEDTSLSSVELSHAEIQELAELKRTRLQADALIVYPDHSELLRKEKAPIIPMWTWRVAAAASVIGLIATFFFNSAESTYTPREGFVSDIVGNVDEILTADYSDIAPSPKQVEEVVPKEYNPIPSPAPFIAQEKSNPESEDERPEAKDPINFEEAPLVEAIDPIRAIEELDPQQLYTEETPKEIEEPGLQENIVEEPVLALEDASAPMTSEVKEYDSVISFLKDKAIQTAEDNNLLAMDDVDEEDRYIRTSFRIGGFEFSRFKRRK